MTVLECKFIFYFCSILSLPRKSLQCVLYMTLLLLIPQLIVLTKTSSARFDTNNVVNIFGFHFSFFSGLRRPLVLQDVPKKINDIFFWPFFWLFLTFWWSYHTKNTRLNIILCSNHHFKSIRIDLKGFEKLAIWPKTPDLGGYDPSPNDSLFWNYKNPFDQFEMITLSIILIAKAGGTQLFEGADLIGGHTRNLA